MVPKWSQNSPKWSQNGPKMVPKWSQNGRKIIQNAMGSRYNINPGSHNEGRRPQTSRVGSCLCEPWSKLLVKGITAQNPLDTHPSDTPDIPMSLILLPFFGKPKHPIRIQNLNSKLLPALQILNSDVNNPHSWADSKSRSTLGFQNLHHRSPGLGLLLFGSPRGSGKNHASPLV